MPKLDVTATVRAVRRTKPVRAVGLPMYRAVRRLQKGPPPRVLANSIPKSGTHLLTALLDGLPDMRFSGLHLTAYDFAEAGRINWAAAQRRLASVPNGQYVSAHLPADEQLFAILGELGYQSLFVLRDPRDAAVSDMHYIAGFRQHPLHAALNALPPDQRLRAVIGGMPGERRGVPLLEPMAERLENYRGWLDAPRTRTVRFEALIGNRGGGDSDIQVKEVLAVANHVNRPLTNEEAGQLARKVWSPGSSTFRRGVVGDWKAHFTEADTDLVKRSAGGQLVALGYESDNEW
jgi:hypothetical protein